MNIDKIEQEDFINNLLKFNIDMQDFIQNKDKFQGQIEA